MSGHQSSEPFISPSTLCDVLRACSPFESSRVKAGKGGATGKDSSNGAKEVDDGTAVVLGGNGLRDKVWIGSEATGGTEEVAVEEDEGKHKEEEEEEEEEIESFSLLGFARDMNLGRVNALHGLKKQHKQKKQVSWQRRGEPMIMEMIQHECLNNNNNKKEKKRKEKKRKEKKSKENE